MPSRALTCPGGAAIAAHPRRVRRRPIDADGALDRDRMRALVFADAAASAARGHPASADRLRDERAGRAAAAPVVFDVPLLVESGAGARASTACWWSTAARHAGRRVCSAPAGPRHGARRHRQQAPRAPPAPLPTR
jgi:dephospho-CoA kinase